MAWSGGTYTRTNGVYTGASVWASDKAASVKIVAGRHDTHDQDLAQGINNCLAKDGQNSPVANINMGTFKFTNLGVGGNSGDSAAYQQLITAAAWATDTITLTRGTGNITITVTASNITSSLGYTPYNEASAGSWASKNQTVSTASPSGTPAAGDVWLKYTP
jgi:hypothetical protein